MEFLGVGLVMPPLTMQVHDYQKIPGTLEVRLIKTTPYVRITSGGQPPILIQGGVLYSEGGQVVTEIPAWFAEEVAKLSPLVRAEVGLDGPALHQAEPQPKPKPPKIQAELWTCQEPGCGKIMKKQGRTFHIMHHARQAKVAAREVTGGDANS